MLAVGTPAPDFAALTERGQEVRLHDVLVKGPLVLIFYPGDSTPVCTKQLCAVRDSAAKYDAAGITVFGVNISAAYGCVLGFGPLRFVNRTVVAINQAGTIVYYKRGNPPTDEIIAGALLAA
jgi:peroxiredoxin Q/BCP